MRKIITVLFLVFVAFLLIPTQKALALPPANFERLSVINSGLNSPTALEFAPDGRLFLIEQGGTIKIYKNGQLLPRIFDELPALAESDRGLLGIAFDPNFNTNHWVYFYYLSLESKHMIVRLDASDDVGKNGPVLIWTSNTVAGSNHAGGAIQFGPDGKLYIAIGEGGNPPNSQNLSNVMGKILRINKDGTIPPDNPFINTPNAKGEIWAYGFRNPFRFQFDKLNGNLFEGEVGGEKWEEVNKVVKGANYGWPLAEGLCTTPGCSFVQPIYAYSHVGPSYSITGGMVYRGDKYPAPYQGSYFFGDYAHGFMKRLTFDASGNQNGVVDFDPSIGTIVDLKTGPDGMIYYLTIFPPSLNRINYTLGNKTPIVKASANPTSGLPPLTVNFSSVGSKDPENTPLIYLWDLGDGTTSTAANPVKTYSNLGKFMVTLTVSDGSLLAKSAPLEVSVGTPPTVSFASPADLSTYKAGDTINYAINTKDSDNNDLPSSSVLFEAVFHHDTHIHPFLRPISTKVGNFTIPQIGEASSTTWYELRATATDSHGLSTTKSIKINPLKVKFTLNTNPANFQIGLDGTLFATPLTIQGVAGFKREIDAITQQSGGQYFEFDNWSDGGAKRHFFTLPITDITYTAAFKPSPPYNGAYFNNPTFSGTPVFTKIDPIIKFNWDQGSPDPRIPNDQFSIRWTKQQFFHFGRYKFSAYSDDGIRIYLDGNLVLDGWSYNQGVSKILDIPVGIHDLQVDYREDGGGANVGFSWDLTPDQPSSSPGPSSSPAPTNTPSPTISPTPTASPTATPIPTPTLTPSPVPTVTPNPTLQPPNSFKGEYFDNQNLAGVPKFTRFDPKINFIWNETPPAANFPVDQYSVRWTKTENFKPGIYHFSVGADDGVRLFIDGKIVLDKWIDQPWTNYGVDLYLNSGNHTIVMEYYEAFGGAIAILDYQPLPDTFYGEYFNNQTLTGSPTLTRFDQKINLVLGPGSPATQIPVDHFSIRWTKKQAFFQTKTYNFTLKSDDGVRFWVDNQLLINDWRDHGMITYTPAVSLSEGMHILKIEYYENNGDSVMTFNKDN